MENQESTQEELKTETEETDNQTETAQENAPEEQPQISEKIKALNLYLSLLSTIKPIIYDKCIKTGIVASNIFNILQMNEDVLSFGENKVTVSNDDLIVASYLANAGFAGIPEYVLYKQGSLSDNEYSIVKEHVKVSANIASIISPESFTVVLDHHELPLAKGYNKKLTGTARSSYVIGIADRYVGSLHMVGSLYRPSNSRMDAIKNAIEMFDTTSQVFSVDQINAIADMLFNINI